MPECLLLPTVAIRLSLLYFETTNCTTSSFCVFPSWRHSLQASLLLACRHSSRLEGGRKREMASLAAHCFQINRNPLRSIETLLIFRVCTCVVQLNSMETPLIMSLCNYFSIGLWSFFVAMLLFDCTRAPLWKWNGCKDDKNALVSRALSRVSNHWMPYLYVRGFPCCGGISRIFSYCRHLARPACFGTLPSDDTNIYEGNGASYENVAGNETLASRCFRDAWWQHAWRNSVFSRDEELELVSLATNPLSNQMERLLPPRVDSIWELDMTSAKRQ